MTISYTAEVATCTGFGCFLKLLKRWRGSIYKLVWMDLIAFLGLYYSLSILYMFGLNASQRSTFESLVHYCNSYGSVIPLSFVLGFYVSIVMKRWWDQYLSIPWPDPVAVYVSSLVHGQDERGRVMRRTVMRYVCLCLTMVLISTSPRVKKRFPKFDHLVDAGLLQESEKEVIDSFNQKFPKHPKHWMPIVWAASIITRARKEGRIRDDFSVRTIIDELNKFRGNCGILLHYDMISIPLVYTQVVTLAVYSYFLSNIMGKQWTNKPDEAGYYDLIDNYFPLFTTLEFFFYMGWLKVAESLINPFGDDDDDFEMNWLIDRNLQVSYLIVDEMHHEHPELIRDQYWDEVLPNELPYANEADGKRDEPPEASTARIDVSRIGNLNAGLSNIRMESSASQLLRRLRHGSAQSMDSYRNSMFRMGSSQYQLQPGVDRTGPLTSTQVSLTSNSSQALAGSPAEGTASAVPTKKDVVTKQSGTVRIADRVTVRHERIEKVEPGSSSSSDSSLGDENLMSKDDFERLREERERERIERQKQNLARSVENATNLVTDGDPQNLLTIANMSPTVSSSIPRSSEKPLRAKDSKEQFDSAEDCKQEVVEEVEEETKEEPKSDEEK